ncbi:MAG: magnesium transporter NIPA-domain-containing protein, partial [Olpidium bornovanus]
SEARLRVGDLDVELLGALDDGDTPPGGDVVGDFGSVRLVVHEQKVKLLDIVHNKLLESVGHQVARLLVRTFGYRAVPGKPVGRTGGRRQAKVWRARQQMPWAEATSDFIWATRKNRTLMPLYRSDWWRTNRFVRFFTMGIWRWVHRRGRKKLTVWGAVTGGGRPTAQRRMLASGKEFRAAAARRFQGVRQTSRAEPGGRRAARRGKRGAGASPGRDGGERVLGRRTAAPSGMAGGTGRDGMAGFPLGGTHRQTFFLAWAALLTAVSVYLAVRASRARDDRNNMLRYIGVCSLIGSLSIVATQGVGPAIVVTVGDPRNSQVRHWAFWAVLGVMTATLVVELAYLNRALGRFSAAIVTPVYYVTFTTATIVSTSIFAQGYSATPVAIASGVMGFFVICSGVYLLQVSRRELEGRAFGDPDKLVLTVSASELRSNPLKAVQDMLNDFLGGDAQPPAAGGGRLSLPFHLTRAPAPTDPAHDQQQQQQQQPEQLLQPGERSRRASVASVAVGSSDSFSGPPDEKSLSLAEFGKNIRIKKAVNLQTGEHANILVPRTGPVAESPEDMV